MDLIDDLCREDRVRDIFQPRLHDAPRYTKWNKAECKATRFGGRCFVTFMFNLTNIETWVHEFTEHAVYYTIIQNILNPGRWGIVFYPPAFGALWVTPHHLLAALVTSGVGDGTDRLAPDDYWVYLKSAPVQSRLTEFITKGVER